MIDDYEIELYEGCKIGDDEEELSCREVMNGLDGLDVLDGPSERPIITLGMTFIDRVKLWKAASDYAIINGFGVKIVNNEKFFLARCQDGCPFRLYVIRILGCITPHINMYIYQILGCIRIWHLGKYISNISAF